MQTRQRVDPPAPDHGGTTMAVKPVPEGYPNVTPYLVVDGAAKAIDFYTSILGATERMRMPGPDGSIGHAELDLGTSVIMLSDSFPDMGYRGPHDIGGTPVSLMVYVPDVDDVFARALTAGATELRPIENQFYGDRSGQLEDPFGHRWIVATHVEDVPPDEMAKRAAAATEAEGH
jgi:PhnB protein